MFRQTILEVNRYYIWYFFVPIILSSILGRIPVLRLIGGSWITVLSSGLMQLMWNRKLSCGLPTTIEHLLVADKKKTSSRLLSGCAIFAGAVSFGLIWSVLSRYMSYLNLPTLPPLYLMDPEDKFTFAQSSELVYAKASVELLVSLFHHYGLFLVKRHSYVPNIADFRCFITPAFGLAASSAFGTRPSISSSVALITAGKHQQFTLDLLILAAADFAGAVAAAELVGGFANSALVRFSRFFFRSKQPASTKQKTPGAQPQIAKQKTKGAETSARGRSK